MSFTIPQSYRLLARLATAGVLALAASASFAQAYPAQRVELVVPYPAGGGTDAIARTAADSMQKILGQPVVVLNQPGASGSIGLTAAATAKPDGYKITMLVPEVTYLASLGIGKVSNENFIALAQLSLDPASITVRADAPWNTIEDFLAYAKSRPETVRIANAGNGTSYHLAAAALEDKAGVKFQHIPYQGSAPAIMGLLSGQVDATTVAPGELAVYVAAGKLKVLGVMGQKRIAGFENVPTFAERGVDVVVPVFRGIGVAKGTPEPIVRVLREALRKASEDPALRARIAGQSMNFSYADGPEFGATMERASALFRQLVVRLKIGKE